MVSITLPWLFLFLFVAASNAQKEKMFWFTTDTGIGWCPIKTSRDITSCTPSTASWSGGWGPAQQSFPFVATIAANPLGDIYAFNSTSPTSIDVYHVVPSSSGDQLESTLVGNVTFPSKERCALQTAQWITNFISTKGTTYPNVLMLGCNLDYESNNAYFVDVESWTIISYVVLTTSNYWTLRVAYWASAKSSYLMQPIFVQNATKYPNNALQVTDLNSGVSHNVFTCTNASRPVCDVRGFVFDYSKNVMHFSTGWQFYTLDLASWQVTLMLDLSPLGHVNGLNGGAWLGPDDGSYWYGDATMNTNYIVLNDGPATAVQVRNALGNIDKVKQNGVLSGVVL
eukprot:TRINITY_DN5484_c0_g2_i1.p1 TRINITY_DN5484_c0_g2~~TRINITY_DN5484_c0_g2_i1.p1  ORF type:complete len:341 (+),score=44.16 TRINITY_DN5484_c0_g2_i1:190-1212(+)